MTAPAFVGPTPADRRHLSAGLTTAEQALARLVAADRSNR